MPLGAVLSSRNLAYAPLLMFLYLAQLESRSINPYRATLQVLFPPQPEPQLRGDAAVHAGGRVPALHHGLCVLRALRRPHAPGATVPDVQVLPEEGQERHLRGALLPAHAGRHARGDGRPHLHGLSVHRLRPLGVVIGVALRL